VEQAPISTLTGRQRQVLALIARGQSNRQIAGELGITEQGVKSHVSRLLMRHGVPNRTALVAATRSWSASDAAVYDAMDDVMATVRRAVTGQANGTNGGSATSGDNGHAAHPPRAISVEELRRQAAELSPDAPTEVKLAVERLREIVRELNVALELAQDLPPGQSSKVLVRAVSRRAGEAEKQVATLEGAITAARR
jgi:DNA-binding CsgD family transcriptional regulator